MRFTESVDITPKGGAEMKYGIGVTFFTALASAFADDACCYASQLDMTI